MSVCAGQGHDLLGVLASRTDAQRVCSTLIEYDARNVAAAQAMVKGADLRDVMVVRSDAGDLAAYVGSVPADLLLLAGVCGNVSDADVHRTIEAMPQLCAPGASVIWTRSRRAPDLTPAIRGWLQAAAFVEQVFHAPDDVLFSVGYIASSGYADPQPFTASSSSSSCDITACLSYRSSTGRDWLVSVASGRAWSWRPSSARHARGSGGSIQSSRCE